MKHDHFYANTDECDPGKQAENTVTAKQFLQFVRFTAYDVLAPQFRVAGYIVTFTHSELDAIYQAMRNREEPYLHYLNSANQEVTENGSS